MRKPSTPQMTLLLAAVANGGYATAGDVSAAKTVTRNAVKRAGWMTSDYRIQYAGRAAVAAADLDAYTAALSKVPVSHLELPARTGNAAPANLIPDGLIQYDVPAGRAATFVGYKIYFHPEKRLRTIMRVEIYRASDGMNSARVYVSDGKGAYRYAANFCIELACYGPEGGPILELAAEVELAEELRAAQPEMARDLQASDTSADEIGIGQDATGSAVAVRTTGAGKTGLAAVLIDQAETVVNISVEEARDALAESTTARSRAMLKVLATADRDDRLIIMDPKRLPPTQVATIEGLNGDSSARIGTTSVLLTPTAGAMAGYDPDQLDGLERAAAGRGVPPATFRRLYPAVTRIADTDPLFRRCQVVRDALVRDLTEQGRETTVRAILGDPREAGYRVALFEVRSDVSLPERIRKGAFYLELALTSATKGQVTTAHRTLGKAAVALV